MVFWDTTYPIEHICEKNLCYKYLKRFPLLYRLFQLIPSEVTVVERCVLLHTTERSNHCWVNPSMDHYFNETDSLRTTTQPPGRHHQPPLPQPGPHLLVSMQHHQHHEHGRELPLLDVAVALHIKIELKYQHYTKIIQKI